MPLDTKSLLKKYEPKEAQAIVADPQCSTARYSPCGKVLVAGSYDRHLRRWNVEAAEAIEMSPIDGHNGWVEATAFHADGELLFSADTWGQIRCTPYLAEKPEPKWRHETAHDGWIRDLAVSPDGKELASCGADKQVRIWAAQDGKRLREFAGGEDIFCLRWIPDGSLVTGDFKGFVKHWKPDGTLIRQIDCSELFVVSRLQDVGGIRALAFDKDCKTLAVGGTHPKNGGTVTGEPTLFLIDWKSGKQLHKLVLGSTSDVNVLDLYAMDDGLWAAITCGTPGQGQLLYVHGEEKSPVFSKKIANPHSLSWHPGGKRFAVAATNPSSNGNGRPVDKNGNYKGNQSPIHIFALPETT